MKAGLGLEIRPSFRVVLDSCLVCDQGYCPLIPKLWTERLGWKCVHASKEPSRCAANHVPVYSYCVLCTQWAAGTAKRFTSAVLRVLGLGPFTPLVIIEGLKELLLVMSIDIYQTKC